MVLRVEPTEIPDVLVVTPDAFEDDRGWFMEAYRSDKAAQAGLRDRFLQLNHSRSRRGVVRGLHFQWDPPQGKLMRVIRGQAFLVAVDIRPGSPTLGRWTSITASEDDRRQLWAPASFARGFAALGDVTDVEYLCTATYNPAAESGIRWDDPEIAIEWPVSQPVMSAKDASAQTLSEWLARPEAAVFAFAGTSRSM
jgi:dTDP-4-dehydrorhamnose 3,5-epimerase